MNRLGEGDPATASDQGSTFTAFVGEELAAEVSRRASLEARGISVITISGTLVTALFAFSAIVTQATTFGLDPTARVELAVGVVLFVLAAIAAIGTNVPQWIQIVEPHELLAELETGWSLPAGEARKQIVATRLDELECQRVNQFKAVALLVAIGLQVAAVIALAAGVLTILAG